MQHNFPFDPAYGYTLPALQNIPAPPEPGDFQQFWLDTYAQARRVPPNPTRRLIREDPRMRVYEVEFDAWDLAGSIRIGGWMTMPPQAPITGGIVGHGYGGRTGPDLPPLLANAAVIYPCARGFNRSARADIPSVADRHVLHGIRARETYVHRGCVADLWAAAAALMALEPAVADHLCLVGESFGGGIGALAIPWEPAFKRAFLDFPSFGHHPLRLQLPCVGSNESIRQHGGDVHLPVLRYFDAATAAAHTRIPVMVAAARFDPAVPPPGQFAIFNALAGEKKLFVRQAAHFDWPGAAAEDAEVKRAAVAWLTARRAD